MTKVFTLIYINSVRLNGESISGVRAVLFVEQLRPALSFDIVSKNDMITLNNPVSTAEYYSS